MIKVRFRGGPSAVRSNRPAQALEEAAQQPYSRQRAQAVGEMMAMWERRLRGYDLFPEPVALEPAFLPFDPALLSDEAAWDALEPLPHWEVPLAFLRLLVPVEQKVSPDAVSALLHSLGTLAQPVSLEVVGTSSAVTFQIACAQTQAGAVGEAVRLAFPLGIGEVGTGSEQDALHRALAGLGTSSPSYQVVDLGLACASTSPLRSPSGWAPDSLLSLIGILGSLAEGEAAGVQLLCVPAREAWGASLLKMVSLWQEWGGKDEPDAKSRKAAGKEMDKALRQKLASPLWAVAPRVFAASITSSKRAVELCQRLASALSGGSASPSGGSPNGNALLALDDTGYAVRDHLLDVLARRSRRHGAILCADELGALWHPPTETLLHPRLVRTPAPTLPPELVALPGAALGRLDVRSAKEEAPVVRWPDAWRTRHFYALGATRMGKSTLLLNLIAQDLQAGRGLCLIDPHGDLSRDVLSLVPPEREGDVFFLDLADASFPPAIGLLDARDEWEERLLVSDLLSILRRLFASSWGDRLEHLLRHALLTLLADKTRRHTLRDVRALLSDEDYRSQVLEGVRDPDLRLFWKREFPVYPASALSPIYNKLGLLFSSPLVRNIAGGSASKLRFGDLMRQKKVLLVDLSSGKIGSDNAHFLGALLVSRLQLSAMHALRLGREERVPFTLYVDEFHAFVVSSFETILSEAGKAGLHLVMANQFLEQLDGQLQTAILSNVGTLVSFRVSAGSARSLEREFGGVVAAETLVDLSRGEAVARLGRAGNTVRLKTFPPPQAPVAKAQADRIERICQRTRETLCRPRAEVEAKIFGNRHGLKEATSPEEERKGGRADVPGRAPRSAEQSEPEQPPQEGETAFPSSAPGGPSHFGWDDEEDG